MGSVVGGWCTLVKTAGESDSRAGKTSSGSGSSIIGSRVQQSNSKLVLLLASAVRLRRHLLHMGQECLQPPVGLHPVSSPLMSIVDVDVEETNNGSGIGRV
jgi:hypothetical protein